MIKRDINEVIVLGCGQSINDLCVEERSYINRCKVVIAVNKFAAYYKMTGIIPTHVYYVDDHENSNRFLQHMFSILYRERLRNITFILNRCYKLNKSTSCLLLFLMWLPLKVIQGVRRIFAGDFRSVRGWLFIPLRFLKGISLRTWLFRVPRGCSYIYVTPDYDGKKWAASFHEALYHFRGSLTTVLNCTTIIAPGLPVKLVGTDFYGNKYFFEEELQGMAFSCDDWTSKLTKAEDKHYSALVIDNETMFDRFGEVMNEMRKTGNAIYVCNKKSLLHTEADVPYCPVRDNSLET